MDPRQKICDSNADSYALIDSGLGFKLERFDQYLLSRPCSQAVWEKKLSQEEWDKADAVFFRESDTKWRFHNPAAQHSWNVSVSDLLFKVSPTDFGHLGIFPEQRSFWKWIQTFIKEAASKRSEPIHILNLFAYSGGSTLAAAKAGAHVCHLDASKGMVEWARENASLNRLEKSPIRWIVDDVRKFLLRELRRGRKYDGIILDPPSFGRGSQGEVFKIEEHIVDLLKQCRALLSSHPLFVLFSCHTAGFSPMVMRHLLDQTLSEYKGVIDSGEMLLTGGGSVFPLPSGTFARWQHGT